MKWKRPKQRPPPLRGCWLNHRTSPQKNVHLPSPSTLPNFFSGKDEFQNFVQHLMELLKKDYAKLLFIYCNRRRMERVTVFTLKVLVVTAMSIPYWHHKLVFILSFILIRHKPKKRVYSPKKTMFTTLLVYLETISWFVKLQQIVTLSNSQVHCFHAVSQMSRCCTEPCFLGVIGVNKEVCI
jgi:hypothetical protein